MSKINSPVFMVGENQAAFEIRFIQDLATKQKIHGNQIVVLMNIISKIAAGQNKISLAELSRLTNTNPTTIGNNVDKLVEKRLIKKYIPQNTIERTTTYELGDVLVDMLENHY